MFTNPHLKYKVLISQFKGHPFYTSDLKGELHPEAVFIYLFIFF